MEFSREDYWSGLPFPSPGDRPNPGIKPRSPALQVNSSPTEVSGKPLHLFRSSPISLSNIFVVAVVVGFFGFFLVVPHDM